MIKIDMEEPEILPFWFQMFPLEPYKALHNFLIWIL